MTSRTEAAINGEKKFLGKPCARGHDGWRYTSSGACIECTIAASRAFTVNVGKLLAEAKK